MTKIATRPVTKVVRGQRSSDGAGVRLTRVIGGRALPDLDPFLLLDEFRLRRCRRLHRPASRTIRIAASRR